MPCYPAFEQAWQKVGFEAVGHALHALGSHPGQDGDRHGPISVIGRIGNSRL